MISFVGFGEDLAKSLHAVAPDGFELVEQAVDVSHGVDPPPHESLAATLVFADEVRPLKHGNVLLHGGEAHRVPAREVRYGMLTAQNQADDVPERGIGQRVKEKISPIRLRRLQLIYNHEVVRYSPASRKATLF